jgi:hypothetical protein
MQSLEFVRHQIELLAFARDNGAWGHDEATRYRELCAREEALLREAQ